MRFTIALGLALGGATMMAGAFPVLATSDTCEGLASLALNLAPGSRSSKSFLAGVCGTLAALAHKWGIFRAGAASARDPAATFEPQRAGVASN